MMRTTWMRRPWFLRPRSVFESLCRLAGWEDSKRDEPPMFPKVRLELFRLERREVVSETLSALSAGWAIGSLSSMLRSDDAITSRDVRQPLQQESPSPQINFVLAVGLGVPERDESPRRARPDEPRIDDEPAPLVDPFGDVLSETDDDGEPFYAMSMGSLANLFESDNGSSGSGAADFMAPITATATGVANTAPGGPEFMPYVETVDQSREVASAGSASKGSSAAAPVRSDPSVPRSLRAPNPSSRHSRESTPPGTFSPMTLTHPSFVIDANKGVVLSETVVNHDVTSYTVDLRAQVSGATVGTYTWDVSQASEADNVGATNTYRLQFNWESFSGDARVNVIELTEDFGGGVTQTQEFTFVVASTSSPAYQSAPTSTATWPTVATPDMLQSSASALGGPHHWVTMADGSVSTAIDLPRYNPSVDPTRLVYNSMAADPRPIFLTRYQIDPAQAVPATVDARLTVNGSPGTTYTYSTSGLNPGDEMPIALQHDATGLATGRYTWEVKVKANYGSPVTSTYSGSFNHVNNGSSAYGAGWWVDGLDRLSHVTGGKFLIDGSGRTLWFATSGGGWSSPAGDFSTLTEPSKDVFVRTLHDGTAHYFNSSGELTKVIDRNLNTTTYTYSGGRLSTITDPNNQVTTFAYDGSSKLDSITDPASRTTQITVSSGKLTAATDPASGAWAYSYDGSGRLTTINDPRSKLTTIAYDGSANRAQTVNQADGATESYVPWQLRGLPGGGTTTATLYAAATSDFTDGRSKTWEHRLDWLGFGQTMQTENPLGNTEVEYRNAHGLLWLASNGLGNRMAFEYNGSGDVTTMTWENDGREEFTYNAYGQVLTHKNPIDATTTYVYDAKGNLTTLTNALNQNTLATYTADGLLKAVTDGNSHTTTFGYDATDRMTTLTDARNLTTVLGYNSASDVTTVTDPLSNTTTYTYNSMGRLTQVTLPDNDGNPANNPVWTIGPDGLGLTTTVTDPDTYVTTYSYDGVGRLKTITDALSHTTTLGYDYAGNLLTIINPLNFITTATYDDAGQQLTLTDANVHTTTFVYDEAGQVIQEINALGHPTTYTYTARGQIEDIYRPSGLVVQHTYSLAGDPNGQVMTAVSPPSSDPDPAHDFTLDLLGRIIADTDGNGHTTSYGYDAAGNQTTITDPLGHTTTLGYNAVNQLESIRDPLNQVTTIGYDNAGNQHWVKDPLNHITTISYDAQNRPSSIKDARNYLTTFTYDLVGRLKTLQDPMNNVTTYGYDAVGNTTTVVDPNNKTTTYHYDAADRLDYMVDRKNQPTSYSYDNVGLLTGEQWRSGGSITYRATYTYNAIDQLTTATDNNSTYHYGYDATTELLETVDNAGTPGGMPTITLTLDLNHLGLRRSITDSQAAEGMVSYGYDNALNVTSLEMHVDGSLAADMNFDFDDADRLTAIYRAGIEIFSYIGYDNANRVTTITHYSKAEGQLSEFTYGYDAASRLTSSDGPEGSRDYEYDNTNQLLNVTNWKMVDPIEEFTYDGAGNRTGGGYSTTTGNRMTADGTYTYTYDDNGNTSQRRKTSDGTVTDYTWDYRNRLTNVKHRAAIGGTITYQATYTYDVFDRRIGILEDADGAGGGSSVQTWTVYDGANAWADFAANGSLTMRYLNGYGMDERYARIAANGDVRWYLTDLVNSVRQIAETDGTIVYAASYSAFGTIAAQSGAGGDRFKYTGREWDAGTGQYFYRARYYGADVGRFRSEDPIGFMAGDVNLFRYVGNHCTALTDPSGLVWWFWPIIAGALWSGPAAGTAQAPTHATDHVFPRLGWDDLGASIPGAAAGGIYVVGAPAVWRVTRAGIEFLGHPIVIVAPNLSAGTYPALMVGGKIYIARFHFICSEMAGHPDNSQIQKYGMAVIDSAGKFIKWAYE